MTYAQLSSAAMSEPTNTKLAGQLEAMFKGETLRRLLLNAYGFGFVPLVLGAPLLQPCGQGRGGSADLTPGRGDPGLVRYLASVQ